MGRFDSFKHCGIAAVTGPANLGIEFDAAEKWDCELSCSFLRAAAGEDVHFMLAMWADEVAHVFDYADQVHFHLAEHLDGFAGVL